MCGSGTARRLALDRGTALVTTNPAAAIGRPERATVEPGKEATFTLIRREAGAAWRAAGVVRNGRMRAQFEDLALDLEPALA